MGITVIVLGVVAAVLLIVVAAASVRPSRRARDTDHANRTKNSDRRAGDVRSREERSR